MKRIGFLLFLLVFAWATIGYSANAVKVERSFEVPSFLGYVQNEIIVVLKESETAALPSKALSSWNAFSGLTDLEEIGSRFGVEYAIRQFPGARISKASSATQKRLASQFKVRFEQGNLDEVMAAYRGSDRVAEVQPIGVHTLYAEANDPYYRDSPNPSFPYDQWHYWDTNSIHANQAWDHETGDPNVLIGILDSGTRYFHVDLGGPSAQWGPDNPYDGGNIFINPGEIPDDVLDNDGNGYIDDVVGYDFVETTGGIGLTCIDQDCGVADRDPDDGDGHGTHVSGTVAAITNNARLVAGVAGGWSDGTTSGTGNGVKLVPCRIGYHASYFGQTVGIVRMDYAAEAMYYLAGLIDAGFDVTAINCSWGSSNSGGLGAAVDNLIAHDVVVVVAAGNSNSSTPDYLGSRGDCLDVAATDQNGNGASFTNYGNWVDVAAPGVGILSTYRNPDDPDPTAQYIAVLDGTSMSAPHVVGIIGLLESCNPSLSATQKFNLVVNNTSPYSDSRDLGSGIADAFKALNAAGCTGPVCDLAADFSGAPTSGCAPLMVSFTDLSSGTGIDGWSWDFGDGVGTSSAQNPSYTYNNAGTYTVSLTVSSSSQGCNDTQTKTGYITVQDVPVANFSGSPTSGTAALTVNFTDLSSGNPTGWSWDFGDGIGGSAAQNPSYTYNDPGTYTVTLTASNGCGSDVETKIDYITVDSAAGPEIAYAMTDIPVAGDVSGSFLNTQASDNSYEVITEVLSTSHPRKTYSYLDHKWGFNVASGTSATFYLEAYRPNNSDGDDFTFSYSTDDATYAPLVTVASATEQVYSASLPGGISGTVYIRVEDTQHSWGGNSLDPVYVDHMYIEVAGVGPAPPIADFVGSPTTGPAPLTVNFTDMSAGSPNSWSWDFGDGSGTSAQQNPSYTYNSIGVYSVSMTATNDYGSDTETKLAYITVTDPNATVHVSAIAVSRQTAGGPNRQGVAEVTILDGNNNPVFGATVSGIFNAPDNSTRTGTTDGNGVAVITSSKTKTPPADWCFEVTDVSAVGYTYDPGSNVWTYACESGGVYSEGDPETAAIPAETGLGQNRPNPFNPSTEISFSLDQPGNVQLEIFNIVGQKVATLVDGFRDAGIHTVVWNSVDDAGNKVSSGLYFYKMTAARKTVTRKMLLLK